MVYVNYIIIKTTKNKSAKKPRFESLCFRDSLYIFYIYLTSECSWLSQVSQTYLTCFNQLLLSMILHFKELVSGNWFVK